MQAYEGVVIAKRNRGLNSSFTVRKISQRRRRGAHVPDVFAAARLDRGQAQGRRAPRQALLPARSLRASRRGSAKSSTHARTACRRAEPHPVRSFRQRRFPGGAYANGPSRAVCACWARHCAARWHRPAAEGGPFLAFKECSVPWALAAGNSNGIIGLVDRCATGSARMKATLYEALGILPTASDEDVRASLRRRDPQVLRQDARRAGQRRGSAALHQSREPHPVRPRPPRSATTRNSRSPPERPSSASRTWSAMRWPRPASRPTSANRRSPSSAHSRRRRWTTSSRPGWTPTNPSPQRNPHHPGLTERVASFGRSPHRHDRPVRAVRRIHRRRHRVRHAGRHHPGRQAGAGVADDHAARRSTLVYGAVHGVAYLRAGARRAAAGAGAADRPRDPQLAAREERVPRHQPAAGGRELDLPAAHGGARARQVRPHERAASVAAAGRAHLRLRDLGPRARAAALGAAGHGPRARELAFWLGHPLVAPMLITGDVDSGRGAAHRVDRHDARQVAVRRLPAVLDLGRVCARATRARSSTARCDARCGSGGKAWAAASRCSRRC